MSPFRLGYPPGFPFYPPVRDLISEVREQGFARDYHASAVAAGRRARAPLPPPIVDRDPGDEDGAR